MLYFMCFMLGAFCAIGGLALLAYFKIKKKGVKKR